MTNAANPVEFWHPAAVARETFLLRDSLVELSRRETGGFPYQPVYVMAPEDGIVGWLLRDFVNVHYITQPGEGRAQEAVLLPPQDEVPPLGGSYVGQDFVIERQWQPDTLVGLDFVPWWTQRRTRVQETASQAMVLWLRQDIYDGVEFDSAG